MKTTFPLLVFVAVSLPLSPTATRAQSSPTITQQPISQTVVAGSNVTLSVGVSGPGPFICQWQLNGSILPALYTITTEAGGGAGHGDGGQATNASIGSPGGVAVDAYGNVFFPDSDRIRKVDAAGIITTLAGNGTSGYSGDGGWATNAELSDPWGVAVDAFGNVFIADCGISCRIRKVDATGIITTIAGNGTHGYSGDGGPATNASLNFPYGVTVDAIGTVFIVDANNNRIRKVDAAGIITTVAGNGTSGSSGDGGAATNARLLAPRGNAVDALGNLFIADCSNNRVRKVDTTGIITTVAGNGTYGYSGDGAAATNASLNGPWGATVDAFGNLFIADSENDRVRKVDARGVITTFAGGGSGSSGDGGPATNASLGSPLGVAVDAFGNLFIADFFNHRIMKVSSYRTSPILSLTNATSSDAGSYQVIVSNPYGSVTSSVAILTVLGAPAITVQPQSLVVTNGQSALFTVTAAGVPPLVYQWFFDGMAVTNNAGISGAQTDSLFITNAQSFDQGTYTVVITNAFGWATSAPVGLTVSAPIPPTITSQPSDQSVSAGQSASFSVTATGSAPLSYQWLFQGTNLANSQRVSGAQSRTLALSNILSSDQGSYQVTVTNAWGQAFSATALLTVTPTVVVPPAILTEPTNQSVLLGGSANFSVAVAGTPPFSYLWQFNGGNTSGSGPSLSIAVVPSADVGSYNVIVSNPSGSVTSGVVQLTIAGPPPIITMWTNTSTYNVVFLQYTVAPDANFQLQVAHDLTPPVQWYGPAMISQSGGASNYNWSYNKGTNYTIYYPKTFWRLDPYP